MCVFPFTRRLDDNIRTVVRGQTNVGQDGRQVGVSCARISPWLSPLWERFQHNSCAVKNKWWTWWFVLSESLWKGGFDRDCLCEMIDWLVWEKYDELELQRMVSEAWSRATAWLQKASLVCSVGCEIRSWWGAVRSCLPSAHTQMSLSLGLTLW